VNIKENSRTAICMELESLLGQMANLIKDNTLKGLNKVKEK
jgi:hypothetical protein